MIIVADENIPCVTELFGRMGEIRLIGGRDIRPRDVRDAHMLLVRSVTRVDHALIGHSGVRFIGSATIGTDHVDLDYLRAAGIAFAHAPGSNADSVVEYVVSALLRLSVRKSEPLRGKNVAVVGVGHIGSRLAHRLAALGLHVLLNDPPRQEKDESSSGSSEFRPLDEVLQDADIVSLHVPLTVDGPHPTYHLIDGPRLRLLKPGAWLLNTSRGPVIDNKALLRSLQGAHRPTAAVLDVWENEPEPDADLVGTVDIATPHIAGYALDAKVRGARALYHALRDFLGTDKSRDIFSSVQNQADDLAGAEDVPPACTGLTSISIGAPDPILSEPEWLDLLVRRMYDIERDHAAMKAILVRDGIDGRRFASLRREYPLRREFAVHSMKRSLVPRGRRDVVENVIRVRLT